MHAHLTVHPSAPIPLYSSSKCRVKVPVPPAIITIRPLTRLPMEELQRMRELQPMRAPGLTNPLGGRCLETPAAAFTQQKITTLINSYHLLHINSYHHVSFARPPEEFREKVLRNQLYIGGDRLQQTNSTSVGGQPEGLPQSPHRSPFASGVVHPPQLVVQQKRPALLLASAHSGRYLPSITTRNQH